MDVDVDSDKDKDTTHDDSGKKESRIDPRVAAPEKEEKLTAKNDTCRDGLSLKTKRKIKDE